MVIFYTTIENIIKAGSYGFAKWVKLGYMTIAGFEIEFRKKISILMTSDNILSPLQLGFNFTYSYSPAVFPVTGASPFFKEIAAH